MRRARIAIGLLFMLPAGARGQSADEAAIRDLFVERFAAYWRAADAEGLASLWREDGDWMNLVGSRRLVEGRAQIERVWSVGLRGRDTEEQRSLTIELDSLRFLAPDVALVDVVMIYGHERTGILREAMVAIVRKDDGGWRISSSRVARIAFTPPAP